MTDALIAYSLRGTATAPGPVLLTPAERALIKSSAIRAWHPAHLCNIEAGEGWPESIAGSVAALVPSTSMSGGVVMPTWEASGGPADQPFINGTGTNIDSRLIGDGLPSDGPWTIAAVCKRGSSAAAVAFGAVGNSGTAVGVRLPSGASMEVRSFASGGSGTARISASFTAVHGVSDWYYVMLCFSAATGLKLFVGGDAAGTNAYSTQNNRAKYSLFGPQDETDDLAINDFRDGAIASAIIAAGDASVDADLKALIDGAVFSRFPALAAD